jgi:hypothetical protein
MVDIVRSVYHFCKKNIYIYIFYDGSVTDRVRGMSSLHFGSQHFHKLNIFTVVCVTAIIFRQFLPTQSVICNRVY